MDTATATPVLRLTPDPQLIKILRTGVETYKTHWVPDSGSVLCLGDSCLLCSPTSRPTQKVDFAVLLIDGDNDPAPHRLVLGGSNPVLKFWASLSEDDLYGNFWSVHRLRWVDPIFPQRVKERDLTEDWGVSDPERLLNAVTALS